MEAKPVRLGELLTAAGVLRREDLNEAVQIATDTGQLIGKLSEAHKILGSYKPWQDTDESQ